MTRKDIDFFKNWFKNFCCSYYTDDQEDLRNIKLKELHTFKVCENILEISQGLKLSEEKILIAEIVALFHDIGRFPQYKKYKTFRDSESVNHGVLGVETLKESKVLDRLSEMERKIILRAVVFHNAFSIPKHEDESDLLFIKLVRDADKLDIWRVFLDYFQCPVETRANAITLGLPDTSEYSKEIIELIFKKETVPHLKVKTINDFKLLQLSWVFDLNFVPTIKSLKKRDYVNRLVEYLPETEEIHEIKKFINNYLEQIIRSKT